MKNTTNNTIQSNQAARTETLPKSSIPGRLRRHIWLIVGAVVVLFLATFPLYQSVDSYIALYLFMAFIYIGLGQGWNIIGGYTGQVSLGSHAFFALGAYITAIIWLRDLTHTWYYFDPVLMILAGLGAAVFAVLVGLPTLSRLKGDYFSFGTYAAAYILYVFVLRGGHLTEGAMGLRLPGDRFVNMIPHYYVALLLAIGSTLAIYFITRSRIGLALKAIREDEISAASHGINILFFKTLAFAIGAFILGVCGSIYAYYLIMVTPAGVMSINWMILPMLITILGGIGTVIGPVIGGFIVAALFTFGQAYVGNLAAAVSGVIIILSMKFMPTGILGLKDRIRPPK